jgi:hypothetical protein
MKSEWRPSIEDIITWMDEVARDISRGRRPRIQPVDFPRHRPSRACNMAANGRE